MRLKNFLHTLKYTGKLVLNIKPEKRRKEKLRDESDEIDEIKKKKKKTYLALRAKIQTKSKE
jgi:hypothetical protein